MKEKFTKGEWVAEDYGSVFSGEELICDTFITGNRYDAHLIAASPKMYAMLEQFKEFTENMHIQPTGDTIKKSVELHEEVQKLLAEARGEL